MTPFIMWLIPCTFTLVQFLVQLSSGVFVNKLIQDFGISAMLAGFLTSSYYYIYTALQTPAGLLMDYIGPRKLLTIGSIICGLGCLLFAHTTIYFIAILGRLLMGSGASFGFIGLIYAIREWFPKNRQALVTGASEALGMLVAIIGSIGFAAAVSQYGWRTCITFSGYLFLILSLLCGFIIRDHNPANGRPSKRKTQFWINFRIVIRNRYAWLNGIYLGLVFSFITVFIALWGIPFIKLKLMLPLTHASAIAAIGYLGTAFGCPFFGYLSAQIQQYRPLLIICSILSGLCILLLIYLPQNIVSTSVLIFLSGFFASGYVLCYSISDEIAPYKLKNTFMGFTNAICVVTAPILQPVVGFILDRGTLVHGHYGLHHYETALIILPLSLFAAAIIAYQLPETYQYRKRFSIQ